MGEVVGMEWLNSPDLKGPWAKAWKISMPPVDHAQWQTTVAVDGNYLLHAPSAHPMWEYHVLLAVALRDVPGQPPANKLAPEMTHEIMVWALHPDHPAPNPRVPLEVSHYHLLRPSDVVVQFRISQVTPAYSGDIEAAEICYRAAVGVVNGVLVPDSDHRTSWATFVHEAAGRISAPT